MKEKLTGWDENDNVHILFHSLCRYLCRWYFRPEPGFKIDKKTNKLVPTKRTHRVADLSKLVGYRAILRMREFAKKHPEIIEVRVDDELFAGSSIFIVPHYDSKSYMGETFIYVSQCSSVQNVFFSYPYSTKLFAVAIQKVRKRPHYKEED